MLSRLTKQVLLAFYNAPESSTTEREIAGHIDASISRVTHTVYKLEERGWVEADDGLSGWHLTDEGADVAQDILDELLEG